MISKIFKKSLVIELDNDAYLRPITVNDVTQLYVNGLNDCEVNCFLVAAKKNRQSCKSVKSYVRGNWECDNAILFGLFINDILRGTIRLHDIKGVTSCIGIAIFDKTIWGQGWGGKILLTITEFACNKLNLREIKAVIEFSNIISQKMFLAAAYIRDINYSDKDKCIYIYSYKQ